MLSTLPPKSPSMSVSQVSSPRPDTISPVSAYGNNGAFAPPPAIPEMPANTNGQLQPAGHQMPPELFGQYGQQAYGGHQQYGQSLPLPPELQAAAGFSQAQGQTMLAEAHGRPVHQMPSPVYQSPGQQRAELQGVSWQSGPTPGYMELDSSQQRR